MEIPNLDSLWDFSNPAATEQRFRALLIDESRLTPTQRGEVLTQIARAQGLQGDFVGANLTLDEVEPLLGTETQLRVRYLLERGRVLSSSDHAAEALPLFEEAWHRAKGGELDRLAVDAAHMVAIAGSKDPEFAMEWNLKALHYAEQSNSAEAKEWLGSLYNNIGWTYFDQKDYDHALEMLKRAQHWRETRKPVRPILIARWSVGRVLRAQGKVAEALTLQREVENAYGEHGMEPTGYVYEEIGECLLALGEAGSQEQFQKAYEALSKDKWLVEHEPARIERLRKLASGE